MPKAPLRVILAAAAAAASVQASVVASNASAAPATMMPVSSSAIPSNNSPTSQHPDAPDFNPDAWNDPSVNRMATNCFQYAFAGSLKPSQLDKSVPNPGETSGNEFNRVVASSDALLNALQTDGIDIVSKQLPPPKKGYYVVGLYFDEGDDFHWVRQDSDGGWSEKPGMGTHAQRLYEPGPNGQFQSLPADYRDVPGRAQASPYLFVGYAYAPKDGMSLGLEKNIAAYLDKHPLDNRLEGFLHLLPLQKIQDIQRALEHTNPKVAPAFADAARRAASEDVEDIAEKLRANKTDPELGNFFRSNARNPLNKNRTAYIGDLLAKAHPDLAKAYNDARDYFLTDNNKPLTEGPQSTSVLPQSSRPVEIRRVHPLPTPAA